MSEKKTEVKYLKLSLTPDEYETLARLSELQGRPMATLFIEFVREANTFTVLKKVVSASEKIIRFKSLFKRQNDEICSSIT